MFLRIKLIMTFIVISLNSFSQEYPKSIIIENDTVLVFTIEQAREITKRDVEREYCINEREILEIQLSEKDTIIKSLENKVFTLEGIEQKYIVIIKEKDELKKICEGEKKELNDEISRQKRHKWFAIAGGFILALAGILL